MSCAAATALISVAEVQGNQQRQICSGTVPHTDGGQAAPTQKESLWNSKAQIQRFSQQPWCQLAVSDL